MKSIILISAFVFFSTRLTGQDTSVAGSWLSKDGDDQTVMICQAGYIVITEFNPVNTAFYYSSGGTFKILKERLVSTLEFTTNKSELKQTGKGQLLYSRSGDQLSITRHDSIKVLFDRVDDGHGAIAGVWHPAGEQGEVKILLVLSANRFQRIHFNSRTNELISSYGGRYDYDGRKYTEHIEFYRKDPDKIGKSVVFIIELTENAMTIKGKNEKGETIDEKWKR